MIKLEQVSKAYFDGDTTTTILKDINLTVESGSMVAIVGPSGSGKSTLLSIMAGLDKPTSGSVFIDGVDVASLDEKNLSLLRNKKVSIVFQSFELVQFFTAYENVMLPLAIRNEKDDSLVTKLLNDVDIVHRKDNIPAALSGGEQQRVAIARALATGSEIIFADEPTGNLDGANGKKVLELFLKTVKDSKKTFVIITHDMNIAKQMDVVYEIQEGSLVPLKLS